MGSSIGSVFSTSAGSATGSSVSVGSSTGSSVGSSFSVGTSTGSSVGSVG